MTERTAMTSSRGINAGHSAHLIVSPLDMSGMIGMAQTWRCTIMGIIPSKLDRYSLMNRRLSHLMLQRS